MGKNYVNVLYRRNRAVADNYFSHFIAITYRMKVLVCVLVFSFFFFRSFISQIRPRVG